MRRSGCDCLETAMEATAVAMELMVSKGRWLREFGVGVCDNVGGCEEVDSVGDCKS